MHPKTGSTLLATIAGGAATYYHPDHLSNRVETDATGAPVRTFGHLPFGETWYEPTGTDKFKFTSYESDSGAGETGLNYAAFRQHSSALGRFMSADLLAGNIGAPQSLNRYAYAVNDPVNRIDPLGLFPRWNCSSGDEEGGVICVPWDDGIDPDKCGQPGAAGCDTGPEGGGSGGGDGGTAKKSALQRLKEKECMDWILAKLKAAYDNSIAQNPESAAASPNATKAMYANVSGDIFRNALRDATVVQGKGTDPRVAAEASGGTITLQAGWGLAADQPLVMIHETVHLEPYNLTDVEMATALKAEFTTVPGNDYETSLNASAAWNKKLEDSPCGTKKK